MDAQQVVETYYLTDEGKAFAEIISKERNADTLDVFVYSQPKYMRPARFAGSYIFPHREMQPPLYAVYTEKGLSEFILYPEDFPALPRREFSLENYDAILLQLPSDFHDVSDRFAYMEQKSPNQEVPFHDEIQQVYEAVIQEVTEDMGVSKEALGGMVEEVERIRDEAARILQKALFPQGAPEEKYGAFFEILKLSMFTSIISSPDMSKSLPEALSSLQTRTDEVIKTAVLEGIEEIYQFVDRYKQSKNTFQTLKITFADEITHVNSFTRDLSEAQQHMQDKYDYTWDDNDYISAGRFAYKLVRNKNGNKNTLTIEKYRVASEDRRHREYILLEETTLKEKFQQDDGEHLGEFSLIRELASRREADFAYTAELLPIERSILVDGMSQTYSVGQF